LIQLHLLLVGALINQFVKFSTRNVIRGEQYEHNENSIIRILKYLHSI